MQKKDEGENLEQFFTGANFVLALIDFVLLATSSLSFIFLVLFTNIAFPIWMIVNCRGRKDRQANFQWFWIFVIVICWVMGRFLPGFYGLFLSPLAAMVYGAKTFHSRTIRVASFINIFIMMIFVASWAAMAFISNQVSAKEISPIRAQIERMHELPPAQKHRLISALNELKYELESKNPLNAAPFNPWFEAQNETKLIELANFYLKDRKLTSAEAEEWLRLFQNRKTHETKM